MYSSEMFYERGNNYEFLTLSKELAAPGELTEKKEFEFDFTDAEKQYESYNGINVRLRCVILVLFLLLYCSCYLQVFCALDR